MQNKVSSSMKMGVVEWVLLIILSIIWGSSFIFIELSLKSFSPIVLVFLRVFIGAVTLTAILYWQGIYFPKGRQIWLGFFIIGLLQTSIPFCLIAWGQQHITAGLASIFNATTPIFTVILSHFLTTNEKISISKLIGILSGIIGVVCLIGLQAVSSLSLENIGQFAVLGAAFCYAMSIVYGLKFTQEKSSVVAMGMLWCASISMLPLLIVSDNLIPSSIQTVSVLSVIALGVVCSAIAYILFFRILSISGATSVSLVTFLIPISTLILAWLFLEEKIEISDIPGILLIFVGLALVDGRIFKLFNNSKSDRSYHEL